MKIQDEKNTSAKWASGVKWFFCAKIQHQYGRKIIIKDGSIINLNLFLVHHYNYFYIFEMKVLYIQI